MINLDFEVLENDFPTSWYGFNTGDTLNYKISLDSTTVKSGKYSVAITCTGESLVRSIAYILPSYDGKKITFSGHIKTEGITEGYAGLVVAIPHLNGSDLVARDNGIRVTGTTDWQKYEITVNMNPANTRNIIFSGALFGNGKMWLDDVKISIDEKDIQQLNPYVNKPFLAANDKEFDNGSGIVFPELSERHIRDLNLLGRIWGFLKYHHQAIAEGNCNWDYELFRFLPSYLKVNDNVQRDKLLLEWIDKLGNFPVCVNCQSTSDSTFLKPDLSWIANSNLNPIVKGRLQSIYQNRFQGHHYHVMIGYLGNPLFLNENEYANMPYPDAGFRLLSLYRYWNTINYFFPYKYLTDKDWKDVIDEYIPHFVNAKDKEEYESVVIRLVGEICDSHAAYLLLGENGKFSSSGGNMMAPIQVRFIEDKLVVTDYYTLKDTVLTDNELKRIMEIQVGDIITHIDGKSVDAIVDSLRVYYPASNEAVKRKNIASVLLSSNRENIYVDYVTSGQQKQKNINLLPSRYINVSDRSIEFHKISGKDGDIGYVRLANLRDEDVPVIQQEFKETKGLILDLRSRPTVAGRSLASWFVSTEIPFEKRMKGNPENPGEFFFFILEKVSPSKETYKGQVVILVNEKTFSEGESQALMFRAGQHTTIIGSQTAGADGTMTTIFLPGGVRTWISGVGVYLPDGGELQRIGVVPDIEVKPTIRGVRERRDELVEKAIEILEELM